MCIVIDINSLSSVFEDSSPDHDDFKHVKNWILSGKGKLVFGGTGFINELPAKYKSLIANLNKYGLAVKIDDDPIDAYTEVAKGMIQHRDFDDPHIVAILKVSGCKLIASKDVRAYPFFRHSIFFGAARNKPRIYSNSTNRDLLVDANIADICKPCKKSTRAQLEGFGGS